MTLNAVITAMVFGLLATEVPAERRSATLNLVYLPLYAAGIIGPALGAIVVNAGLWAPFWLGADVYLAGGVVLILAARGRRPRRTGPDQPPGEPRARLTAGPSTGRRAAAAAGRPDPRSPDPARPIRWPAGGR